MSDTTVTAGATGARTGATTGWGAGKGSRFRLTRAGVLNVWQYDDQVFDFADGRLLLRGANGAGKSKTMEMLLPFVLDGDKGRLTASGKHHTSLLWLMLDGHEGSGRTGYLWVELSRERDDGSREHVTCGVGLRATQSARSATAWFFIAPRRVGVDLDLENEAGPLSQPALESELGADGHVYDQARRYREHVGRELFGLGVEQYEELLRLIYWLRQPQVGEDIEPTRLAGQLVQALPVLDRDTLRAAGDTFEELEAFGEQIDRRAHAADAVAGFVDTYAGYARSVLAERARVSLQAHRDLTRSRRRLRSTERDLAAAAQTLETTLAERGEAEDRRSDLTTRIATLENSPEARSRAHLLELAKRVDDLERGHALAVRVLAEADRSVASSDAAVRVAADALLGAVGRVRERATEVTRALRRFAVVVPADLPPDGLVLPAEGSTDPGPVRAHAQACSDWAAAAGGVVTGVRAAVTVVTEALGRATAARADAERAQHEAEALESRLDHDRARAHAAAAASRAAEEVLVAELEHWRTSLDGVELTLPPLTAEGLERLGGLAHDAVAERRERAQSELADATARVRTAEQTLAGLDRRRAQIEAETDPSPPAPHWRRGERADTGGAPLWRLVDFRPDLDPGERAGLEAALEGAGLLDAWIEVDGRVHRGDREDVWLGRDATPAAPHLGTVLVADVPPGSAVPTGVVELVLAGIALGTAAQDDEPVGPALGVSVSGDWRSGPLAGRTGKPTPQFIGATARAAERDRRLEEVDAQRAAVAADREAALGLAASARADLAAVAAWVAAQPRHRRALEAWAAQTESETAVAHSTALLREAEAIALRRREAAAARHTELVALAERHDLPVTPEELAARALALDDLTRRVQEVGRSAVGLEDDVVRWIGASDRATADQQSRQQRSDEERQAAAALARTRAEHEELDAAQGAEVRELELRLARLRSQLAEAQDRLAAAASAIDVLTRQVGGLEEKVRGEQGALDASESARDRAVAKVRTLTAVPGLLDAVGESVGVQVADGVDDPATLQALVDAAEGPTTVANAVLQAMVALQSGPAALTEPRLLEVEGVYAAVGRDDSGDRSMPELARHLAAGVAADRELLSERERELFENHVLGTLGDALRAVRRTAGELVVAMNEQLKVVTTSQGIRVRLRWQLREDVPADARRAVKLLGEPLGALLPDERSDLRDALHRLIDLSRAESPGEPYSEHLARALDYRQWSAFTVQYHRPETGEWRDLHRKSALSQGEQKVLCYLPLFAAAAAHFTSVAGAAPHAPRFVLLDDAFPKIDARTHPLLFGLLVQLDLDFVVTSERLWGTHDTVPSLAIYEALRSPTERGIAQYQHRWDGQRLTAVGA